MNYSENCKFLLRRLESSGFQAYIVGGCVRDMLLGRKINDMDITTNASPQQVMEIFSDLKVIPTGIKHGTVTVLYDCEPFEITTFRIDRGYSDSRRPDSVEFSSSLEEDLARRDFTVNAIAMDINGNIHDPFNGEADLKAGILRCVGEPEKRFSEDALRILRCIRFLSVLGFKADKKTAEAAMSLKEKLNNISRERCRDELCKMLMGDNFAEAALEYREIISQVIPEFRPCFDFQQHTHYHCFDVYEHIIRTVEAAPKDIVLRTAMFFHDIGKPQMFTMDDKGVGHFKGHASVSAVMAQDIMKRLRWDNDTINRVCTIISMHSDVINTDIHVKRIISKIGADAFFMLIEAKKADNCAKHEFVLAENDIFDKMADTARMLIRENACMSLKQLAVNGEDIASAGAKGRNIGNILNDLLENVMNGSLPNEKTALINYAKEMLI